MFSRRILHHGSSPTGTPVVISDRAVAGCWFELHRYGGCGGGELTLRDEFVERNAVSLGDWISLEYSEGDRWYLGRVEERRSGSPAGIRLRLEGMGVQLNEVFPGGFGLEADGLPPHRYARTDRFSNDPDRGIETFDSVEDAVAVVRKLMQQYVVPQTAIQYDDGLVEEPVHAATVESLKFRGEESARAILKELAMRAQASWGVDEWGKFFFFQPRSATLAEWKEGRELISLAETTDREHLFNRVLLTGDYVYDVRESSGQIARRSYRWRGNFVQPESRTAYGERRIRLWIPWLRTQADTLAFVREFFRSYSQPTSRYLVETGEQVTLPRPWLGRVRIEDRQGGELITGAVESIRVLFDHVPRFRLEIGPEDPRTLWPEPPQDERWELPETVPPGGNVLVTDQVIPDPSEGPGGDDSGDEGGGESSGTDSDSHSGESSGVPSDDPSEGSGDSSDGSFPGVSGEPSDGSIDPSTWNSDEVSDEDSSALPSSGLSDGSIDPSSEDLSLPGSEGDGSDAGSDDGSAEPSSEGASDGRSAEGSGDLSDSGSDGNSMEESGGDLSNPPGSVPGEPNGLSSFLDGPGWSEGLSDWPSGAASSDWSNPPGPMPSGSESLGSFW